MSISRVCHPQSQGGNFCMVLIYLVCPLALVPFCCTSPIPFHGIPHSPSNYLFFPNQKLGSEEGWRWLKGSPTHQHLRRFDNLSTWIEKKMIFIFIKLFNWNLAFLIHNRNCTYFHITLQLLLVSQNSLSTHHYFKIMIVNISATKACYLKHQSGSSSCSSVT